mmetsp:Transcript_28414/g.76942  ORF Transcript_28414/g.76942 Transcript_28414/m.76942 type:complete len:233 (+) Transcript_28414:83-781(+)
MPPPPRLARRSLRQQPGPCTCVRPVATFGRRGWPKELVRVVAARSRTGCAAAVRRRVAGYEERRGRTTAAEGSDGGGRVKPAGHMRRPLTRSTGRGDATPTRACVGAGRHRKQTAKARARPSHRSAQLVSRRNASLRMRTSHVTQHTSHGARRKAHGSAPASSGHARRARRPTRKARKRAGLHAPAATLPASRDSKGLRRTEPICAATARRRGIAVAAAGRGRGTHQRLFGA